VNESRKDYWQLTGPPKQVESMENIETISINNFDLEKVINEQEHHSPTMQLHPIPQEFPEAH
jgi:hypothetical protein